MTRDEILTALRCCVSVAPDCCKTCPAATENGCEDAIKTYAADLIENQQRHIDALMQGDIQRTAELLEARQNLSETRYRVEYMDRDLKEACQKITNLKSRCVDIKNELCQYCGKYKHAHEGACDGCKWRDM